MRYIKLYLYFLRFSFSKAFAFRFDFSFRVIMDIVYYIIQFLFFEIIYLYTPILGGWGHAELRIFISAYLFIDAFNMSFFANNSWWLPQYINNGTLDYYLTKPVSSMFFLSLREFAANSFVNLLIASALLWHFIASYPSELGFIKISSYILLLVNGSVLYFFIQFISNISTLWTGSPRGFTDLFYSMSHTMERPHEIFSSLFKKLFTTILPFSIIASYPTKFLFKENSWDIFIQCILTCFGFYLIALFLWKKGLSRYSSASS